MEKGEGIEHSNFYRTTWAALISCYRNQPDSESARMRYLHRNQLRFAIHILQVVVMSGMICNVFSPVRGLTRAALSTGGRAKSKFLSVMAVPGVAQTFLPTWSNPL
jgi:hypothetical protein